MSWETSVFLGNQPTENGNMLLLKVGSFLLLLALAVVSVVLMYFVKKKVYVIINNNNNNSLNLYCQCRQKEKRKEKYMLHIDTHRNTWWHKYNPLRASHRNPSISPSCRWSRWWDPATMITSTSTSRTLNTTRNGSFPGRIWSWVWITTDILNEKILNEKILN